MPGGPIYPYSAVPVTPGKVFENVHIGAGATSKHELGMGVMASLDGDAIWCLRFEMPPSGLPTGTGKLRLRALANATTGAAKIEPKWVSVAMGEDASSATLNTEGVQTVTWAAGNADDYLELKVTLDADTLVASEIVVMDLQFNTSGYTLAQVSTWGASLIFE